MLSRLCTWILNRLGWTIRAEFPGVEKYVLILAPHTSNWDFPLGMLAATALKLDAHWIGKHSLFRWPFGWFFRALGGTPVDRSQARNLIQQMAELFARSDRLVLGLAPEGTRARIDHWKTGFYHIAVAAHVPIVMAYLDYQHKEVGLGAAFYPSDDIDEAFARVRQFYADKRGKFPGKESLIQVRPR